MLRILPIFVIILNNPINFFIMPIFIIKHLKLVIIHHLLLGINISYMFLTLDFGSIRFVSSRPPSPTPFENPGEKSW